MEVREYLEKGENLPDFIKDFHDQKDLFKTIYTQWKKDGCHEVLENVNCIEAHQFTIDIFLWWMGMHGYKLQKIRKKDIVFHDPIETIYHYLKVRKGSFEKILKDKNTI